MRGVHSFASQRCKFCISLFKRWAYNPGQRNLKDLIMRILLSTALVLLSSSVAFAADMPAVQAVQPLQISANQLSPTPYAPQPYYGQQYAAPQQAVSQPAAPVNAADAQQGKVDIMWMNSF